MYDPIELSELPEEVEFLAESFEEIFAWRSGSRSIDFLNLSLGVSGIIENYSEDVLREPFEAFNALLLQEGSEDRVVFIWAAGNAHGTKCDIPISQCVDGAIEASSVDLFAGLGARFPELQETSVAVVAIRPDGEIADFSNRCGIAAEYCLAAPGDEVLVSYFGPDADGNPIRAVATGRGTSYAAPMVTGGLAVMKQYFRGQISNTDLLSRLLETANSSGIYADLGDLRSRASWTWAQRPPRWARRSFRWGNRVESAGAALSGSNLRLGLAFGDALVPVLEGQEIAAFDQLGAPFWYDVGSMVSVAASPSLHDRFRDFQQRSLSAPTDLTGWRHPTPHPAVAR